VHVRVRTQGRQQHSAKERSCELAEEDGRQGATGDGRKEGRTDVDGSKDHGKKEGQKKEGRKVQRKEGRKEGWKEGRFKGRTPRHCRFAPRCPPIDRITLVQWRRPFATGTKIAACRAK